MTPVDSSDRLTKLDINDLPLNQQDRVIRFVSELAKSLRQIQSAAEQPKKNNNSQETNQKKNRKVKDNEQK